MEYKISLDTLNLLLKYLGNRPYVEVIDLVEAIKKVVPVEQVKVADESQG